MKYGFKRILSIFLAVLMLASMLPLSVYADEEECLHEYTAEVTDPTCTEQGYTTYTCSLCGSSYEDDYTEASGHTPADAEEVPATCTESGRTAGTVCAVCGEALSGCEEIPASGHSYEAAVTEPTDTEQGYTTYTCALCGDSYTDNYTGPNADGEELLNPEAEELSGLGLSLMASGSPEDSDDSGTCGTSLTWTLDKNYLLTISGSGAMTGYPFSTKRPWNSYISDIKSVIIKNGVTSIGECAFSGCTGLTSITIPDSVTSIGKGAFWNCNGLTSITLPEGLTTIGDDAFHSCYSLSSITIPASVTTIGSSTFHSCYSLSSITIPDKVTSIGDSAFENCPGLTSITIPDSVKSISDDAFFSCGRLADVFYKGTSDEWNRITIGSNNDCLTEAHIHYSPTGGGECGTSLTWKLDKNGLLTISGSGAMADYGFSATPWYSFSVSIKSVVIEHGVTSIGSNVFEDCTGLTSIAIPDSVETIGSNAFYGCSNLTSITIPDSVTSIGTCAFIGCSSLASITIPSSVTSIGEYAFSGCGRLADVFYKGTSDEWNSITIGSNNDCLTEANIHHSPTDGGECGDNLSWVLDADGTLYIAGTGAMADYGSAKAPWYNYRNLIKSAIIENGVTTIGSNAFWGCTGLTSITIPASVTSIGDYAFEGCGGLTSVFFNGTEAQEKVLRTGTSTGNKALLEITWVILKDKGSCGTSLTWTLDTRGVLTISGTGAMADYDSWVTPWYSSSESIKSVIIKNGVTSIGRNAFNYCGNLTSITIPASVTSIGASAFENCKGLTSIPIPDSVKSIGEYAFAYSGLASIEIPASVETIGSYAFKGCSGLVSITMPYYFTSISIGDSAFQGCFSLPEITIPDGVTTIGDNAFEGCTGLTKITIPDSVTSIGTGAFRACSALTSISVESGNTVYSGDGNCLIEKGSGTLILGCKNSVIPEGVKSIGDYAFSRCTGLTSITIPDSVKSVSSNAFEGCSALTSITVESGNTVYSGDGNCLIEKGSGTLILGCKNSVIPEGVKSIGEGAFNGCTGLTSITIPDSVKSIGEYAFAYSGLASITIPSSVTTIGDYAFSNCTGLTSITIPDSVKSIGEYAFEGCRNLTSITLPESLTSIGEYAFYGCSKLTSVFFNGTEAQEAVLRSSTAEGNEALFNIKWIKDKGSCGKNLSWVLDTNGVLTISGTGAMPDYGSAGAPWYKYYSLIKSAIIENGVTSIGGFAFTGCSNLTSINIPSSVKSIGEYAFAYSGLASIEIPASVETIGSYAFNGCNHLTNITIPASVETIGEGAFQDCTGLTSITIPDSVKSIGEYAFNGCSSLASITIPVSVETIGRYAFNGCNHLTNITIPASVETIGEGAFQDCTGLTSITIPSSVTSIGESAFEGCSSLTSITIPSSVTSISEGAFAFCSKLTSITIPDSVKSIGEYAFAYSGLASITVPASVETIGSSAFEGCSNLTSITIPSSVTSISEGAFAFCSKLTSITIPDSVKSIGNLAFYGCDKLADVFYKGTSDEWDRITIGSNNDCLTKAKIHHSPTGGGECGENLSWVLYADGTLYIAGTGVMPDYASSAYTPWYSYWNLIKSIIIENGVTTIGSNAFYGCEVLTSITIPDSVKSIGAGAFSGCTGLTSITIPSSVKSIGEYAFAYSGLASITIPASVETIGSNAFNGCIRLSSITIPSSVKSIGEYTFAFCSKLTNITIPDSVKSIGEYAFYSCSNLTSITIPYGVTTIGDYAFFDCKGLTSITIPSSVKSIGEMAFYGCDKLADVFYKGTSDEWNKITIGSNNDCLTEAHIHHSLTGGECGENLSWVLYADGTLYIAGTGVMTGYGSPSDTPWYSYWNLIKSVIIENGVTTIGSNAFYGCYSLTSITIPASVTSIGEYAFAYSGLASITIPDSVASIGDYAFNGCTGLENVYYDGTPIDWKKISIGSSNGCLTGANIICSIPFAEAVTISYDSQDITGKTVDADMYRVQTYQLTATAAPDNAKQQFTWTSSSTGVATVDTNGLVTFRKPGTVTITAAATDGSGKNAKVTFNVKYYDAAAKFTASTDVPSIGLEVGHSAQISVFGEDKTTALGPSMFEYTLSSVKNGPFIEVSDAGKITAIKPGGTTTVTAELKDDPLGRKVTVSVKTIPVQTKTVFVLPPDGADIHTANDNYAEGFCAIDANGNIPSSADGAVSYALFVNKIPKGTVAEPRFVKVNAIDSNGNQVSLPNTDYTWTSSNTKIATVAKDGTITIKSNVDGACTITATSKDLAKAQGSIAVYVMDKTPRLDAAKVTLDVQKANTASVALVSSYGNDVDSVIFKENKSGVASTKVEVKYANEQITVKALEFLKNQTIKGQLVVKTKYSTEPYEFPFNVVIKNSAPSVTVKQPSKFNLFYTDSSAALNVSVKNEQIKSITLDSDYFKGTDNGDGTVTVEFKTPDPKPATKATLKIHLVGYEQPVEKAITIGTVTTKPKLTVTPASAVINTLLGGSESVFAVYDNTGKNVSSAITTTTVGWADLTVDGDYAKLTLTGTTGGKAAISVWESNWASPITVYHTVNVKATDPVAKTGTGTLTLNSKFKNTAETTLTLDQANVSITGINKDLTAVPKGVDKDAAGEWFCILYESGELTAEFSMSGKAAIESGALKTGTYSYKLTPYVEGVDLNPVTLKISVKNTIPTVTASSVTLNKRLNETGVSTLKLSSAGYTVTGAVVSESNPNLYVTFNIDGTLTVKLNSEAKALKAQTFNVTLTPTVRMDGYEAAVEAKPFTLKVSMIDKAPSASVSASGKIDAVSRGTGITYTLTKLSNAVGSVSSAELTGDNASMFTLTKLEPNDKGQPRYMLTLKDDAVCATNVTYKIMLRFTLDSGDVIETPVLKVKPAQSSLKLTAAPAAQIFYQSQSRDRVVTYTVKLTSPAGAEIGSIVPGKVSFWQNSLADQTKRIEISLDPDDKSVATVAITLKDTARFTSGKSYTLPLEVRAAGYAENTSVTKLNLTLKVMK